MQHGTSGPGRASLLIPRPAQAWPGVSRAAPKAEPGADAGPAAPRSGTPTQPPAEGHPWRVMSAGMDRCDHRRGVCAQMGFGVLLSDDHIPVEPVNAFG